MEKEYNDIHVEEEEGKEKIEEGKKIYNNI